MHKTKLYMIRARVSTKMKRELERQANQRGEAEAVLIREALNEWIAKRRPAPEAEHTDDPEPSGRLALVH